MRTFLPKLLKTGYVKQELKEILEERYGEVESIREDSYGRAHSVYFAKTVSGQEVVVKAAQGDYSEKRFRREPEVLRLLEKKDYPAPRLLTQDLSSEEYDFIYLMMSKEEGRNIDSFSDGEKFKNMQKTRKKQLLQNAGELLGRLHDDFRFEEYGDLENMHGLEVDARDKWSEALRDIMEKHSLRGLKDSRFSDLSSEAREYLQERLGELDTGDKPRLVHQDFRFGNLLVEQDQVSTVLDWERAISGHREYDLFKAERNFTAKFKTETIRDEYQESFLEAYRNVLELQKGWKNRRQTYQIVYLLEAMWTFDEWSSGMPEEVIDRIAEDMRKEFRKRIRDEETIAFPSM